MSICPRLRAATRPRLELRGPRCLVQRRRITERHLARLEAGREQWAQWAGEIRAGKRKSMLEILEERGFVNAIAGDRKEVNDLLIDKRIGAYVGIDPTAPSLHIGHMIPLMALFWMHLHGFHTVSLLGATTAKVGDPTGRTSSRTAMTPTQRKVNLASMHFQVKKIWINLENIGKKFGYEREVHWHREVVNNATWWNKLPFWDVLRIMGKGLRMGAMLSRDTVKTKMASSDGMSFAEFCYPIMQAWDWWYMYDTKQIQFQIGGSDQFGNIVAGIDAIKYILAHPENPQNANPTGPLETPYGFTTPLLTTAAGQKFGKSEGNAIWLDSELTSVFDLYGFFVRTADADVERYLKLFTFLPIARIHSLMAEHAQDPSKRIPQHALAAEFVELIHGKNMATAVAEQHAAVFTKPTVSSLLASSQQAASSAPNTRPAPLIPGTLPGDPAAAKIPEKQYYNPASRTVQTYSSIRLNRFAKPVTSTTAPNAHVTLPKSLIHNRSFAKILYSAGLVSSKSEGHRLAASQGAYVGCQSSDHERQMTDDLQFRPIRTKAPEETWRFVIRDHADGGMEKEGEEGLMILRVGKWNVRLVRVVSDELFERLGLDAPDWAERKEEIALEKKREAAAAAAL